MVTAEFAAHSSQIYSGNDRVQDNLYGTTNSPNASKNLRSKLTCSRSVSRLRAPLDRGWLMKKSFATST